MSLFHDDCPQILIENKSSVNLRCAQSLRENGGWAPESKHFKWVAEVEHGTSIYYTMPFVSEKFPELPQTCFSERIVFAVEPKGDKLVYFSSSTNSVCR